MATTAAASMVRGPRRAQSLKRCLLNTSISISLEETLPL